jgi:hypothetical protein
VRKLKEERADGPMQNIVKSINSTEDMGFLLSWEMVQVLIRWYRYLSHGSGISHMAQGLVRWLRYSGQMVQILIRWFRYISGG